MQEAGQSRKTIPSPIIERNLSRQGKFTKTKKMTSQEGCLAAQPTQKRNRFRISNTRNCSADQKYKISTHISNLDYRPISLKWHPFCTIPIRRYYDASTFKTKCGKLL